MELVLVDIDLVFPNITTFRHPIMPVVAQIALIMLISYSCQIVGNTEPTYLLLQKKMVP